MELFINYGEDYFDDDAYAGVPRSMHFRKGSDLLRSFHRFTKTTMENQQTTSTNDLFDEKVPTDFHAPYPPWLNDLYHFSVHSLQEVWESTVLKTLPDEFHRVEEVLHKGIRQAHAHKSIRSIEWLEDHGSCIDNLEPGTSTIPYAGRGAFATRPMAEGETIVPVPLIHVSNRQTLNMYRPKSGENYWYPRHGRDHRIVTEPLYHRQLLLNYCFGHAEVDLLLCPYGVGTALINHSREQANAKIIWSEKLTLHSKWLEMKPDEWVHNKFSGLAWEYVASRDIEEGEEIFLDYGEEWEEAWSQHVANWTVPKVSCIPVSAFELNRNKPDLLLPTVWENRSDFYSLNDRFCDTSNKPIQHFPGILCNVSFLREKGLFSGIRSQAILMCVPIGRSETSAGDIEYMVELRLRYDPEPDEEEEDYDYEEDYEYEDDRDWITNPCREYMQTILFGMPGDVFHFIDRPYTRDSAQPWSFRHEMQIPDEILPHAWKKEQVNSVSNETCDSRDVE